MYNYVIADREWFLSIMNNAVLSGLLFVTLLYVYICVFFSSKQHEVPLRIEIKCIYSRSQNVVFVF